MKFKKAVFFILCFITSDLISQDFLHWDIISGHGISLNASKADNLPYHDNIEMSGKRVSGIIHYSIDTNRQLTISRDIFFPQLRTFIKSSDPAWKVYRAYYNLQYEDDILPNLVVNNKTYVPGEVEKVIINGQLNFKHLQQEGLSLTRTIFPSTTQRLFVEQWTLTNVSKKTAKIYGRNNRIQRKTIGVKGEYSAIVTSNIKEEVSLPAGESYTFSIGMSAALNDEPEIEILDQEYFNERAQFLTTMRESLILETPNPTLNTLFEFSKIRASESIFESKLGLVHSPGGGRYYVGFWANDQAEYVGPFFPYLGYDVANDAAMNMYNLYTNEIREDYSNIRYSFEIEGDAPINPLDRGDAAMIVYGASQYVLATGDILKARKLWPLIEWCLEYNHRQLNVEGVVKSESDEMEGRIETGAANLSTSSLYYGALSLAMDLAKDLKKPKKLINTYEKRRDALKKSIEAYFGAEVEGLETYKYYEGHNKLRHWICLPLVVQLFDRKEGTVEALFDRLWTDNGVHVEKNNLNQAISEIFWDRGTLYALRGTFLAGATEESIDKLSYFSEKRLLANRVPYVVEAYPEGNMAHLSAESGLYCRVFTEGMFGIVPTGLKTFTCTPRLPKDWDQMALRKIKAFGEDFDIEVSRDGSKVKVKVVSSGKTVFNKSVKSGSNVAIELAG